MGKLTMIDVLKSTKADTSNLKVARFVLIILCSGTLSLIIAGASTNKWVNSDQFYENRGLWKYCTPKQCWPLDDNEVQRTYQPRQYAPDWLKQGKTPLWLSVCRVTVILAAIFNFIAIGISILGLFNRHIHGYYSSMFMVITFAMQMTGVYLFSEKTKYLEEGVSCGLSWGLSFFAVICAFLSGFTGFCTF